MKKIFLIILPALAFLQCTAPKVETGKSNFKELVLNTFNDTVKYNMCNYLKTN